MSPPALEKLCWLENQFLPNPTALFDRLVAEIAWDSRIRARRVASFGVPYNYSGMQWPACPIPAELESVLEMVAARVGFQPNNCLVNFYPDGSSTMGFHRDAITDLEAGTGIAVVSLGAEREIAFRWKNKPEIYRRLLRNGSLLYMTPELQIDWRHGIEAVADEIGGRISLTFRRLIVLPDPSVSRT